MAIAPRALHMWESYRLHTCKDAYILEPTSGGGSSPTKEILTIHRDHDNDVPSFSIAQEVPDLKAVQKTADIYGILGIIPLHTTSFLVVITERSHVDTLADSHVYTATNFDILPISSSKVDRHHPIEKTLLELLKSHLYSAPFYFSYGWDLTSTIQRQCKISSEGGDKALAPWYRADERFFWNRYLSMPLIEATTSHSGPDLSKFILPCIFGFLSIKRASINGHDFVFGLIARRSRHRAGTRYFSRGVDADGNVSNFNETEQFMLVDPKGASKPDRIMGQMRFSYVQTRGSVPIYWAEINNLRYKPDLVVMEREETAEATAKHFKHQVDRYGENYLVNLVNQSGYEKPVKEAYERAVKRLNNSHVHYTYYDFHHECKGMKFEKVWDLIGKLEKMGLKGEDWFEYDEGKGAIKEQSSVVRTNCMDCLDRTNVVQSTLGRWVLTYQLRKAGVLKDDDWVDKHADFMYLFRNVWADHADGVSRAYSGTGALKTDFTRTGKRSTGGAVQDGVNSVTRYVKNNFFDGPRQDAYDLFTGAWTPQKGVPGTKRSLALRAMPYVLLFSLVMVFAAVLLPHHHHQHSNSFLWRRLGLSSQSQSTTEALTEGRHVKEPFLGSYHIPLWLYLVLWTSLFIFSFRFITDQGIDFVAYPSLNRGHYDQLIKYDGKGWTSGKHGRGSSGVWGTNRKGGKYHGMLADGTSQADASTDAKSSSIKASEAEGLRSRGTG